MLWSGFGGVWGRGLGKWAANSLGRDPSHGTAQLQFALCVLGDLFLCQGTTVPLFIDHQTYLSLFDL